MTKIYALLFAFLCYFSLAMAASSEASDMDVNAKACADNLQPVTFKHKDVQKLRFMLKRKTQSSLKNQKARVPGTGQAYVCRMIVFSG